MRGGSPTVSKRSLQITRVLAQTVSPSPREERGEGIKCQHHDTSDISAKEWIFGKQPKENSMTRSMIFATLAILLSASSVQSAEFLAPRQALKVLADGQPWAAQTANGPSATITLNKDGTGTFQGPFTLGISWEVQGDNVCLNLSIAGQKCVRFVAIDGGFDGYVDNKVDIRLTR
jgi:hypothetical protein